MTKYGLYLQLFLLSSLAWALPPEGLESFAMLAPEKSGASVFAEINSNSPIYEESFETASLYGTLPSVGRSIFSLGGNYQLSNKSGDRDAYFGRLDFRILETLSLSAKWLHEDWKYIKTGKESIGTEANLYLPFSKTAGFYTAIGIFRRWLKQQWDGNVYTPTNFDTNDKTMVISYVFGLQGSLGPSSYITFDINNRNVFSYRNFNNIGFDFSLNLKRKNALIRFYLSLITSDIMVGAGAINNIQTGLTFAYF